MNPLNIKALEVIPEAVHDLPVSVQTAYDMTRFQTTYVVTAGPTRRGSEHAMRSITVPAGMPESEVRYILEYLATCVVKQLGGRVRPANLP